MLATADDSVLSPILNKVLVSRCFYHLHDPATIFKSMLENCKAGTLCLTFNAIETRLLIFVTPTKQL